MDIYPFFNSKDVAEYLKNLNYAFTLPEAAFIVYQSQYRTMDEKFAAWQELIDTMPDCPMPGHFNMREIPSFHRFLRCYLGLKKRILQRDISSFFESDGAFYTYETYGLDIVTLEVDLEHPRWNDAFDYFESAEAAISHFNLFKDIDDIDIDRRCWPLQVKFYKRCPHKLKDIMNERFFLGTGRSVLTMTWDLKIIDCNMSKVIDSRTYDNLDDSLSKVERELLSQFDKMCFAFPHPFHRGDILFGCSPRFDHSPFVLEYISTWDTQTLLENGCSEQQGWVKDADQKSKQISVEEDFYNMEAHCCYLGRDSDGFPKLCDGFFKDYLSFERYDKPLKGMDRLLEQVSSVMTHNPTHIPSVEDENL